MPETELLVPKLATAPIALREPERAARESAALLVLGSHAIANNYIERFKRAMGEVSDPTKINLLLEPILIGAAHLRLKSRQIAADGLQAGMYSAHLHQKILFYVAVVFGIAPTQPSEEEFLKIPRVPFVETEGYERARELYELWSVVRNDAYLTARSRFGLRMLRWLYGDIEIVRLSIREFVRRSFADDHVEPGKTELTAYAAETSSLIESIARWLTR